MTGTVVLTMGELQAVDQIVQASRDQLREALRQVPSYQRVSVVWVARALGDLEDTQAEAPRALAHQRARRAAILERHALEAAVASSDASPAQKAILAQHVAHLWAYFDQALTRSKGDR